MDKFDKILTGCIKDIKSGRATLSGCLDRYPSLRHELEPLLKLALSIREPGISNLDSDFKQTAKIKLLQQISSVKQQRSRSFTDIFSLGIPARFVWARAAVMVVVIVVILSLLAGGTAYASRDSLPGDVLYPVKISTEDARLLLAFNNRAKAELNLRFARTRLEEIGKLASVDEAKAGLAVTGYQANLDAAGAQIGSITDTSSLNSVLGWALENLNQQTAYCDAIVDSGSGYLGPVEKAGTLSVRTQVQLLRILEQHDIVQAARSNVNAMQNRLRRAFTKAGEEQYRVMEQVLLQYRQFNGLGEEILQRARDVNDHSAEVEALSLQALPGCLETLESISLQVPYEYRNTIEACRQLTLQFETQARYQYRYQGGSGGNTPAPIPGFGEGPGPGQGGQAASPYQGGPVNTDNGTAAISPAPSPVKGQNTGSGNEAGNDNATGSNDSGGNSGSGGTEPGNNTGLNGGGTGGGDTGGGGTGSNGGSGTGGGDAGGGTGPGGGPGTNAGSGTGGG